RATWVFKHLFISVVLYRCIWYAAASVVVLAASSEGACRASSCRVQSIVHSFMRCIVSALFFSKRGSPLSKYHSDDRTNDRSPSLQVHVSCWESRLAILIGRV